MRKEELDAIYSDLAFDKDNLHDVWLKQAELFFKYSVKMAEAERVANLAKNAIDAHEAALYDKLRLEKEHSGYKWTETAIINKVKKDVTYLSKQQEYLLAKKDADIYKYAVESFRQRRDMVVQASKASILEFERMESNSFQKPSK